MTAVIYGEHLSLKDVLETSLFFGCGNCHKKLSLLELRVRVNDMHYNGICCPHCGAVIANSKGNSRREQDVQELRKSIISLVNEVRFKLWEERQAGRVTA